MGIVVVGSVALDTVQTPKGRREEVLGGSATYFSFAASFFSYVSLVAVVGEDFPEEHKDLLRDKGVDLEGLEVVPGKTFRWEGVYEGDMNEARTLSTCLNVFETFKPELPLVLREVDYLFLANIHPGLQKHVLEQVKTPKTVIADTMNLWIDTARDELHDLMRSVDIFVLNEKEARDLTGTEETFEAGKKLLGFGPEYIVIKKGAHGAELVSDDLFFAVPAYPVEEVVDPTGAGDCFAGGFVGYLAKCGRVDNDSLRKALGYGTVTASFNVEDFSLERLKRLTTDEIEARFEELSMMTELD